MTLAKLAVFALLGTLIQGVFLSTFILVSRTTHAEIGKPLVMAAAFATMAVLVWRGTHLAKFRMVVLLPLILSLGYTAAFHLVGAFAFPGLLRDMSSAGLDYFISVLRVTFTVWVLYGVASSLMFFIDRIYLRR